MSFESESVNVLGDHKVASASVYFSKKIPKDLLEIIRSKIDNIKSFKEASVGTALQGAVRKSTRTCDVHWLHELDWVTGIMNHYVQIANREVWEYDLTTPESVQVTRYRKNEFYNWHCDYGTSTDPTSTRKLSASLILNHPSEYSGGRLQLINYHGKIITVPKEEGSIIVFDSRIPHRVTPVLKGERISLVSWVRGPKLK